MDSADQGCEAWEGGCLLVDVTVEELGSDEEDKVVSANCYQDFVSTVMLLVRLERSQ